MQSPPNSTDKALLCLFRSSLAAGRPGVSGELNERDVARLAQSAIAHGLVPWQLRQTSFAALPERVKTDWQAWERQNRLKVLANWATASRVISLLESAGISSFPVKGVALSQLLYGDPWMRPAGDVDLWLEKAAIPAAHRMMIEAGYSAALPPRECTPRQWTWILDTKHSTACRDRYGMLIELHWCLHDNILLNGRDEFWVNEPINQLDVLGRKVLVLPEATQYLLVMSHLARSGWGRLIWVLDSWKALEAARRVHTENELTAIVADHGALEIHNRFLAMMKHLLEDHEMNQWPPPGFGTPHERRKSWGVARNGWDNLLLLLRLKRSARYRLSVLRAYLIDPIDFGLVRLPDWLFWLYAPLRIPLFVYRRYLRKRSSGVASPDVV